MVRPTLVSALAASAILVSVMAASWLLGLPSLPPKSSRARAPDDPPQAFAIEGASSVSGRVLTKEGDPIPGARVQALEELGPPDARIADLLLRFEDIPRFEGRAAAEDVSASDGSYELPLDPGYYTVRAIADGFAPGEITQVPSPRDRVDVRCEKGIDVAGAMCDTEGRPVAEARIDAYPEVESQNVFDIILAKLRPPLDSRSSDPSGAFVFRALGPGVYNFRVTARGYQEASLLRVPTSASMEPLRVTLKPGLVIRGVVLGPDEKPVAGARVRVTPMDAKKGGPDTVVISFDDGSVVTDETGAFRFDTLGEGKHGLLSWHQDLQTAQERDLEPGGEEMVVRLGVGARLRGRVLDKRTGTPIAGATVIASDVSDITKVVRSKDDGSYALVGLRLGSRAVNVTASANGYARVRLGTLRLQEGADVERDFELVPTGTVTGRVVTPTGNPLAGVRVTARRTDPLAGVPQTLDIGVTDREGRYRLRDVEGGEGTTITARRTELVEGASAEFSIAPGETVELPDLALREGGTVRGRVLGPDGQALFGCLVRVYYEGDTEILGWRLSSGSTNQRGEYVMRGLRAGVVRLAFEPPRLLKKTVEGIRVEEGATTELDVRVERGGSASD